MSVDNNTVKLVVTHYGNEHLASEPRRGLMMHAGAQDAGRQSLLNSLELVDYKSQLHHSPSELRDYINIPYLVSAVTESLQRPSEGMLVCEMRY